MAAITGTPASQGLNGTTALAAAEAVVMSTNITLPAGGTGRIEVTWSGMAKIVCVTGGSASARVRLRINGSLHPNSERRASLSNVNLTIDDWPLFTHGYATALPAGVPILVELLGVGVTVGASSASLNNWSMLFVKMV